MPTDVLDVVVEEVTTDPWHDFVEGPSLNNPITCWCCGSCSFAQPDEDVH